MKILTQYLTQKEQNNSLQQHSFDLQTELKQGKNRLQQRRKKSEVTY